MMIESGLKNTAGYDDRAVTGDSPILSRELLAPAGDEACLFEAVSAGADAIYAGVQRFGARAYAGNFSVEGFIRALKYVHLFDRKMYLTLNTLIKEKEMPDVYDLVRPLYEAGLDGIIVQDIGVVAFIRKNFPDLHIHASTQMSINTRYGLELLSKLGVKRVVLSRELQLPEIKRIAESTGMELECFIHGAMCLSYSGQCLMSSFYGNRSGNRGRCAGPCRLPYSSNGMKEAYLLSMKDMCTIDILDKLFDAKITSFKIEGRMKSPAYVAGVTAIYRKYMDMLRSGKKKYKVDPKDRQTLISLYSREGAGTGYYECRNSLSMMSVNKSGYQRLDKEGETFGMKRKEISAVCVVEEGKEITLILKADDVTVSEKGMIAEKAKSRALSDEDIKKQIIKTGDSFFAVSDIEIRNDGLSFVPVSALNDVRRRAADLLFERLDDGNKRSL